MSKTLKTYPNETVRDLFSITLDYVPSDERTDLSGEEILADARQLCRSKGFDIQRIILETTNGPGGGWPVLTFCHSDEATLKRFVAEVYEDEGLWNDIMPPSGGR